MIQLCSYSQQILLTVVPPSIKYCKAMSDENIIVKGVLNWARSRTIHLVGLSFHRLVTYHSLVWKADESQKAQTRSTQGLPVTHWLTFKNQRINHGCGMFFGAWLSKPFIKSIYPCLNSSLILDCNLNIFPNSFDFIGHPILPPILAIWLYKYIMIMTVLVTLLSHCFDMLQCGPEVFRFQATAPSSWAGHP